ncbi:MAG: metallophosphoesterase [Flavobacteriales bacterium]|nr:metallophosphoesterase [Flavobacteriales bacterium]
MNRLLLFLILSGAVLLFDLYAYQGLKVVINGFPGMTQRIIKVIFWGLTVITLLSFILYEPLSSHEKGRKVLMLIATIGVANILGKLLFVVWLLIDDAFRGMQWVWQKLNPPVKDTEGGISRNEFLAGIGAISATLPILTMTWGVVSGAHDYTVRKRRLNIANLPANFEGYKILQISDIHCGSFWNRSAVQRGVEMINAQAADAVFFTGDMVNNKASELEEWTDVFGKIQSKDGIFSVLGNHDYGDYVAWETPEAKQENLNQLVRLQRDELGWDLLINEHRMLERGGERISVIGIENWGAKGRFPKYGDLKKASDGISNDTVQLLLSHDPSHWKEQVIPEYPHIDAMFAGHTHGMQFGIEVGSLKWSPVRYFYPEWADLYKQGGQQLYVNRGFGYIGYPGRFGILPEITVFTLHRA